MNSTKWLALFALTLISPASIGRTNVDVMTVFSADSGRSAFEKTQVAAGYQLHLSDVISMVVPDDAEKEGVERTINRYFEGHATGDASHMRQAFLPTAHIEGIRDGEFTSWTLDQYCALFNGEPAEDEMTRTRTIDLIDISGNAATARATLDHGSSVFTDYFVLLKVGGEWRIANKVYYGRRN